MHPDDPKLSPMTRHAPYTRSRHRPGKSFPNTHSLTSAIMRCYTVRHPALIDFLGCTTTINSIHDQANPETLRIVRVWFEWKAAMLYARPANGSPRSDSPSVLTKLERRSKYPS